MFKRITGHLARSTGGNSLWLKIRPLAYFLRVFGLLPIEARYTKREKVHEDMCWQFQSNFKCLGSILNVINFVIFLALIKWIMDYCENFSVLLASSGLTIILPYLSIVGLLIGSRFCKRHIVAALNSLGTCSIEISELQATKRICDPPFRKLKWQCWLLVFMIILAGVFYGALLYADVHQNCSRVLARSMDCFSVEFILIVIVSSQPLIVICRLGVLGYLIVLCYVVNTLLVQITSLLSEVMDYKGHQVSLRQMAQEIEALRLIHQKVCKAGRKIGSYFAIQIIFIWITAGANIGSYVFESAFMLDEGPSGLDSVLLAVQLISAAAAFVVVLVAEYILTQNAKRPRETLNQATTFSMDSKSEFQILMFLQRFNDFQRIKVSPLSPKHVAILPFGCDKCYDFP